MATFAAIIGDKVIFPTKIRSVAGGLFITNDINALFTPTGFVTPYWAGASVMKSYLNGETVPTRNACFGELGFLITHEKKVYGVDLWKEHSLQKNASAMSLIPVHAGNDSQYILGAPQSIGASVRMAFHLCKNDFDKAMRLLSRRCNIVARDYVCMTIDEIAQRLTEEGKTNELMQLDPVRWTSPD